MVPNHRPHVKDERSLRVWKVKLVQNYFKPIFFNNGQRRANAFFYFSLDLHKHFPNEFMVSITGLISYGMLNYVHFVNIVQFRASETIKHNVEVWMKENKKKTKNKLKHSTCSAPGLQNSSPQTDGRCHDSCIRLLYTVYVSNLDFRTPADEISFFYFSSSKLKIC